MKIYYLVVEVGDPDNGFPVYTVSVPEDMVDVEKRKWHAAYTVQEAMSMCCFDGVRCQAYNLKTFRAVLASGIVPVRPCEQDEPTEGSYQGVRFVALEDDEFSRQKLQLAVNEKCHRYDILTEGAHR